MLPAGYRTSGQAGWESGAFSYAGAIHPCAHLLVLISPHMPVPPYATAPESPSGTLPASLEPHHNQMGGTSGVKQRQAGSDQAAAAEVVAAGPMAKRKQKASSL